MDQNELIQDKSKSKGLNIGRKITIGGAGLAAICANQGDFKTQICVCILTIILAGFQFILDFRNRDYK